MINTVSLKQAGLMALLLLTVGFAATPVAHAADKQGVVIQISDNDPAKWNLALNNAKNIQNDLGKNNVQIEIVAYGPGINMLKKDSDVGPRLDEVTMEGITVSACQNTMHALKLSEKDMHKSIGYVPSGAVEIIKKQKAGWAYVRP